MPKFVKNKISVVIPALNEASNIALCIEAVQKQGASFVEEIIVADHNSTDDTKKIAFELGCAICEGGLPAAARNYGAKRAKGEYLFFLDADTIIEPGFFESALKKFHKKKLAAASFHLRPSPFNLRRYIIFSIYGWFATLFSFLNLPLIITSGCCIMVKNKLHILSGGFDPNWVVLEEYDYIKRLKKMGRFLVLTDKVKTSTRRFEQRGVQKIIILFIYYFKWLFGYHIKEDTLGYWNKN
jgi:glycosyltransferase involved in cell wall biosynthesis